MQTATKSSTLELHNLAPEPAEEWRRLLNFVGLTEQDKRAMSRTVETLMRRAVELVVGTYDYLLSVPETAAILGWNKYLSPRTIRTSSPPDNLRSGTTNHQFKPQQSCPQKEVVHSQ